MGYYTRHTGEISIVPPLAWSEIKDSPFVCLPGQRGYGRDLKIVLDETTEETSDGTLIRRRGIAIAPVTTEPMKGYRIVEELQSLLNCHAEGQRFIGFIEAEGEDPGDLWRLMVKDGQAVQIKPRIIWPDEDWSEDDEDARF
ncbi:hypothetical protein FDA94_28610 [Herbidospora galbida]|uniref:Uncharacterized protein n=1 Tax=Herbidospora galbida TaxID=2575442 RepID=A0A4U3M967_9ACTN|nr:DUF6205 family protein [Herbidospora galbida]TKK84594.1 hypothetical protein FDA94_28610 [Herbidospora galbida]